AAAYRAAQPDPAPHHTAAAVSPTPSGVLLRIGPLTVRAPAAWKAHPVPHTPSDTQPGRKPDSYFVSTWTKCGKPHALEASLAASQTWCPGFHLFGASLLTDPSEYIAGPYQRTDTYASMFNQDEGMNCPDHDELRAVGVADGAVKTADRLAPVGTRKAEYREWRVPCYTRDDPDGFGPTRRTSVSYTERLWYLPQSKILIVDQWSTPGLDRILADATWS
ncbi:hypothetical protein ABZ914_26195, partial [Spirillospora sp. NPDC046719]